MHFGQFLIQNGAANAQQILAALDAQRRAAPYIGQIAVRTGMLDITRVLDVLDHQARTRLHFAEQARALGYLTEEQSLELRRKQKDEFVPIGEILVEHGVLTHKKLITFLRDFLEREGKPVKVA